MFNEHKTEIIIHFIMINQCWVNARVVFMLPWALADFSGISLEHRIYGETYTWEDGEIFFFFFFPEIANVCACDENKLTLERKKMDK